ANPLDPANLVDLQAAVVREQADVGLAFDGDADRCFVVDELGNAVSPSALTALIAVRSLASEPGAHVIHNLITSKAVPEVVARHGGVPVRTQVGHSLIKATMADTNAVFGGEHSGHYYFRDFWFADSGMLAALHLLAAMAATDRPVSRLVADYDPYVASGEINTAVVAPATVVEEIAAAFAARDDVRLDTLDGLTVTGSDWWLNVRASNTEPLLRLNVEAESEDTMASVRDRMLSLIKAHEQHNPTNADEETTVKLDPVLLDILVCPDCKGSLTVDYDNDELICNQCGLIYPVRDDIPVMLVDEARRSDSPLPGTSEVAPPVTAEADAGPEQPMSAPAD
ncbi:MAG: hypothetical protein H0V07_15580, partial [Propionibacteriales bacterium]|nr:hypothetical protein [Propionibacteriales bacterium]